LMCHKK